MTDADKDTIDASAKTVLRDLHAAITNLARAEQIRVDTALALSSRRRKRAGGLLNRWAGGGVIGDDDSSGSARSRKEAEEEERENGVKACRESVLWYLRRRVEECGALQGRMMEVRIGREVERSKSALYKARGGALGGVGVWEDVDGVEVAEKGGKKGVGVGVEEMDKGRVDAEGMGAEEEEQMQMLKKENRELIKHYENKLDQVRYVRAHGNVCILLKADLIQHRRKIPDRNIRAPIHPRFEPRDTVRAY